MGQNCCKSTDPNSAGGKSMVFLPYFYRSRIIDCIDIAERLKGSPPSTSDIFCVMSVHYRITYGGQGWFNAFLQNMYREDLFYADKQFTFWTNSLEGPGKESFEKFSPRFKRLYPGYVLDDKMRIRARPETAVVNLQELVALLRSKDVKLWKKAEWIFENECKYLDG